MTFDRDELLAAFRERRGPSTAAVDRIAARLDSLGPARERGTVIELAPQRRVGRRTRIAVAVAALAAAALLGWWIRGVTLEEDSEAHGSLAEDRIEPAANGGTARTAKPEGNAKLRRPDASVPSGDAPGDAAPTDAAPPGASPPGASPPGASPPDASPTDAAPLDRATQGDAAAARSSSSAPRARASRARSATPAPPEPSVAEPETPPKHDTLADETRIIIRARAQLSLGRASQALATLAEHADRFPRGALAEEAAAVRTMAQCRLRTSDAARIGAAFVERFPKSLFRAQVDAACPSAEKPAAP